jgi:hypothetical protein
MAAGVGRTKSKSKQAQLAPPPKASSSKKGTPDDGLARKKKKKMGIPKNELKKDAGRVFADIAATTEEKNAGMGEFHVLPVHSIQDARGNFRFIKHSFKTMRQDLQEAELELHQEPIEVDGEWDVDGLKRVRNVGRRLARNTTSIPHIKNSQFPWHSQAYDEGTVIQDSIIDCSSKMWTNRYNKRNEAAQTQKEILGSHNEEMMKLRDAQRQKNREERLRKQEHVAKMWQSGANPAALGPGTYDVEKYKGGWLFDDRDHKGPFFHPFFFPAFLNFFPFLPQCVSFLPFSFYFVLFIPATTATTK